MAKLFPKVRCSIVTITTIKGVETYIVPSETADEASAHFYRPDAEIKASGNLWAQVTETDGESFSLETTDGRCFYLEAGDPGYERVCAAYKKLLMQIEQEKRAHYDSYN